MLLQHHVSSLLDESIPLADKDEQVEVEDGSLEDTDKLGGRRKRRRNVLGIKEEPDKDSGDEGNHGWAAASGVDVSVDGFPSHVDDELRMAIASLRYTIS